MVNYHECHITLDAKDRHFGKQIGEAFGFHWSEIEGDEVMGPGINGYLTKSIEDGETLKKQMNTLCLSLENYKIVWKRRKIEHITFDERNENATV